MTLLLLYSTATRMSIEDSDCKCGKTFALINKSSIHLFIHPSIHLSMYEVYLCFFFSPVPGILHLIELAAIYGGVTNISSGSVSPPSFHSAWPQNHLSLLTLPLSPPTLIPKITHTETLNITLTPRYSLHKYACFYSLDLLPPHTRHGQKKMTALLPTCGVMKG